MKALGCWVWILTGLFFLGFIANIIVGLTYFDDIFTSHLGWGWLVGLWFAQFAGVMFMVTLGLYCKQVNYITSHRTSHK